MNNSLANRRSPLGAVFPGQPIPRLYDRAVDCLRTRQGGKLRPASVAGLSGLTGRPKTGGEFLETEHQSIRRSSAKPGSLL